MCCSCSNLCQIINALIGSIILIIFNIIFFSLYPSWQYDGAGLVLGISVMRIIFIAICLLSTLIMIFNRCGDSKRHKTSPCLHIERILSVLCLAFAIIVFVTRWFGFSISIYLLNKNTEESCGKRCARYEMGDYTPIENNNPPFNYIVGEPSPYKAYICGTNVVNEKIKFCEFLPRYTHAMKWNKDSRLYNLYSDCVSMGNGLVECYSTSEIEEYSLDVEEKDVFTKNKKPNGFVIMIVIGVVEGLYWIAMIVNWAYLTWFTVNGNPDEYSRILAPSPPVLNQVQVFTNVVSNPQPQSQINPAVNAPQQQYVQVPGFPQSQPGSNVP